MYFNIKWKSSTMQNQNYFCTNLVITVIMKFSIQGFPGGSVDKESACKAGDLGFISELRRSPGEGNSYSLQYSGLVNFMDRGAWQATVHGVAKSQTQLSDFHFHSIQNSINIDLVIYASL